MSGVPIGLVAEALDEAKKQEVTNDEELVTVGRLPGPAYHFLRVRSLSRSRQVKGQDLPLCFLYRVSCHQNSPWWWAFRLVQLAERTLWKSWLLRASKRLYAPSLRHFISCGRWDPLSTGEVVGEFHFSVYCGGKHRLIGLSVECPNDRLNVCVLLAFSVIPGTTDY